MTTTGALAERSRVSFTGAFRSEWIKARSLRSTWWLAGSALVTTALMTAFWTAAAAPTPTEESVLGAVLTGFFACQIFLILFGNVLSTADYENHAISVFLAAVPRRTPLVLAKMALSAVLGLTIAALSTVLSFGVSVWLHGGGASMGDSGVLRVLGEIVVYGACISVISTAAGMVLRSTIAAFGGTLAYLYIVPLVIGLVPLDAFALFSDTFPGNASTNFFTTALSPSKLDPVTGLIATLAWTAAWLVFAVIWVKRRNA